MYTNNTSKYTYTYIPYERITFSYKMVITDKGLFCMKRNILFKICCHTVNCFIVLNVNYLAYNISFTHAI